MDAQLSSSASARKLVRRVVDQLRYPCCFNEFVKDLQRQQGELIEKWNGVDGHVKNAKTKLLNVPVVHAWLERGANPLKGNVEELLKEAETRTNKTCCFVRCPNWIWRYRMAKKLARKKVEVQKCIEEGDMYIRLEDFVSSPDTQNLSTEKSLEFYSRKDAFEQVMKALKDDEVSMIGLYGMGGCGKTTMAIELRRTAEDKHLFDEVHFVTVSNNNKVEVRSIQDKIAKVVQLPLKRDEETDKRAKDLCTRLTLEHKRILMILDDVWQEIDFGAIGIPSGENRKKFKVLITTRLESVCSRMNCQKKIPLSILTDEEAWALFQKEAHISEGTFDSLKHLGRQISNECKGLPVAIAALAGTLKGKAEGDWHDALNRLRNSIPVNINEADLKNPYKCLRVSYDNLDSEEAKSLLLLCSVFPEDSEIYVEQLIIFAIGLGLVGEVRSFEEERNKLIAAKNKLISSCLLSLSDDEDEGECVKIHDLVRDVAIWIASEENKVVKCLLEEDVSLECNSIRYLWCNEFPSELNCSRVELLCLLTNSEVSDEIFKGMGRLRVLFLCWEGQGNASLSIMSFKSLTNLRCLILREWELGDISSVGYMKKLDILMLDHCSFLELPNDVVTQLRNLRLLYLEECDIERSPFEVIGRHPQLEELYIYDVGSESWDHAEILVPPTLWRYQIKLGSIFKYHHEQEYLKGHRALVLDRFDTSNASLKELAKKAEVLCLANIKGCGKNIIPNIFEIEGGKVMIYGWIELRLCDSEDIECLVDTSNLSWGKECFFSKLCKLRIENMKHFGALYHGVPPNGLFEKLEKLYINNCPMLTYLFTPSIARSLVRLEKLKILSCDGLKHILAENDLEDEINKPDHILVFSKLKKLLINKCKMLEYIFPITFAQRFEQLESLDIDNCSELKYVFGQRTCGDHIQNEIKIELPALKSLRLVNNSKMMSIFPQYCSTTWPSLSTFYLEHCLEFDIMSFNTFKVSQLLDIRTTEKHFLTLEHITIKNSSKIESIFSLDGPDKIRQPVSLPSQYLNLWGLDQMKYICVGMKSSLTFQNLKRLLITRCEMMEVIFPASVLRSLPELQHLEIRECQELKQIIEEDDVENQKLSQPCFPKLSALVIIQCDSLKRLFCVSASKDLPNLEFLAIQGANKLQELISCEQGQGDEIGKVKVELPTLKLLVLVHLSNLCQGIELPTLTVRVVYDCPKLSLTSSVATLEEFDKKLILFRECLSFSSWWKMHNIAHEAIQSHHIFTPGDIGVEYLEGSTIQKLLGEIESTIEIPQSIEGTETTIIAEAPASVKTILPTIDSELATPLHEIPSSKLVDQESTIEPSLLDQRHEVGETISIEEDKIKESIQDVSISADTAKAAMSAGTEDNGLPVLAVTLTEIGTSQSQVIQNVDGCIQDGFNLIDKEGEICLVSNRSIEVHQDASSCPSLILAELGAFKHSAGLNDAQIALLDEAIAVYPHLWKSLDKFSTRFQALMLTTLADMLFFLRNESAASVTPQRENEFLKLCDVAVQLGFDKSWVDEMRQRVMVSQHVMVNELLQMRDQLTQEICKMKDKIDNIHNFVDSQKKCFDFL